MKEGVICLKGEDLKYEKMIEGEGKRKRKEMIGILDEVEKKD